MPSMLVVVLVAAILWIIAIIPSFLFLNQHSQTVLTLQGLELNIEKLQKQIASYSSNTSRDALHSVKTPSVQLLECLQRKSVHTTSCWNAMRRRAWLDTLDEWSKLPEDQFVKFRRVPSTVFELFAPTYECDAVKLKRIGSSGDGGKWICEEDYLKQDDCVVFSLGSNGQFDFEQSISKLSNGKCKIHTFDCTGVWSDPTTTFHPWCLAYSDYVDETNNRIFKTFSTIIRELKIDHVSYLKMDIEGYEWAVFSELFEKGTPLATLPRQISFELHVDNITNWGWSPKQLGNPPNWAYTMIHLGQTLDAAGYRIAVRERNVDFKNGYEYVLIWDDTV